MFRFFITNWKALFDLNRFWIEGSQVDLLSLIWMWLIRHYNWAILLLWRWRLLFATPLTYHTILLLTYEYLVKRVIYHLRLVYCCVLVSSGWYRSRLRLIWLILFVIFLLLLLLLFSVLFCYFWIWVLLDYGWFWINYYLFVFFFLQYWLCLSKQRISICFLFDCRWLIRLVEVRVDGFAVQSLFFFVGITLNYRHYWCRVV